MKQNKQAPNQTTAQQLLASLNSPDYEYGVAWINCGRVTSYHDHAFRTYEVAVESASWLPKRGDSYRIVKRKICKWTNADRRIHQCEKEADLS